MPSAESKPPTDYRRNRRRTDRVLLWMVIGALLVIGGGLIGVLYGRWGLTSALLCLLPGAAVILLLWGFFALIERWLGE